MSEREDEDVVLRFVHTADWHLGKRFVSFPEKDRHRLTRARLDSLDEVFGVARSVNAQAILCAGDLFDDPDPGREWWEALAQKLAKQDRARPIFLLPGNHDPLVPGSVYQEHHPFRRALPAWVHVVDRDDFTCEFYPGAVLYAVPCRSRAGQDDPTASLPAREPGDPRIRIGMVHGNTVDIEGSQSNYPIALDAAVRKGLDYLAVGDHHGYRVVPTNSLAPTVYPGTHEPTNFGEREPGGVCLVEVYASRRAVPARRAVGHWTWEDVACTSLSDLRSLRDGRDRKAHVVRLKVDMRVAAGEYQEAERILQELEGNEAVIGRVGVLQLDKTRLVLDTSDFETLAAGLPPILRSAAERLQLVEREGGQRAEEARRALLYLVRCAREA